MAIDRLAMLIWSQVAFLYATTTDMRPKSHRSPYISDRQSALFKFVIDPAKHSNYASESILVSRRETRTNIISLLDFLTCQFNLRISRIVRRRSSWSENAQVLSLRRHCQHRVSYGIVWGGSTHSHLGSYESFTRSTGRLHH